MALIMEIMKTIAMPIGELALWLEETYQVDINETIGKWGELTGMKITVKENVTSCGEETVETIKINKKIPKIKTKDTCQHTFLSGQKVGEQCTTKPKNGAAYCSAHKPKDSIKSTSSTTKKSKKKEIKQVDKIDSEFESDCDKVPVKEKKASSKKSTKKVSGDTDLENSDVDVEVSEPEIAKPLLKKKSAKKPTKKSKKSYNTDEEHIDKELNLSDEE
jgi:hypothetical protein